MSAPFDEPPPRCAYNNLEHLIALTHHDTARGEIARYTWEYDNAGRVTTHTSPDGAAASVYDANGQLLTTNYNAIAEATARSEKERQAIRSHYLRPAGSGVTASVQQGQFNDSRPLFCPRWCRRRRRW